MRQSIVFLPLFLLTACGDSDKKGDSESSGNVGIQLQSSQLGLARGPQLATSCSVAIDSNTTPGLCVTPVAVTGSFSSAQLGALTAGRPIRLLGGGNEKGPASIFKHADFDLASSPEIPGDDNIQDGSADTSYTYLAIQSQQIEFAFQATPANKIYHIRTFFVNSKPSTESAFASTSCRLSAVLPEADTLGTLISGLEAKTGDILVCVKDTVDEACADTDYKWVDSTGTLVTTRPTTPKAQSGNGLIKSSACPADGADWGYTDFNLAFANAFSISASFGEGGIKTYVSGAKKGTKLVFKLDVDLANSLFVPASTGITDLSSITEAAVLNGIQDIMLKSQYVRKNRPSTAAGEAAGMLKATAELLIE